LNRTQVTLIGIVSILLAVIPISVPDIMRQAGDFTANYVLFLGALALMFAALVLRLHQRKKWLFVFLIIISCAINYLPPMKQWTTFFGPGDSLYLQCRETRLNDGLNTPRYFNATGTAFLAANLNIYPRLRYVQGYDSLVLRDIADTYREYLPQGVKRGRRFVTKPREAPPELLRITGAGHVIHNPLYEDKGTMKLAKGVQVITTETGFPECVFSGGTCELIRESPEIIHIKVNSSSGGDLTVAEAYYPAWHFTIDGGLHKGKVVKSSKGFISVLDIPGGEHNITITYRPDSEKLGLILSIFFFILGATMTLILDRMSGGSHGTAKDKAP